jgi:ABC-type phosphate transport system permease subunit
MGETAVLLLMAVNVYLQETFGLSFTSQLFPHTDHVAYNLTLSLNEHQTVVCWVVILCLVDFYQYF